MKDAEIRNFLTELYETGQQNDACEQKRSKKMLNDEIAEYVRALEALA